MDEPNNNLNTRFAMVRVWLIDRGVRNYISVFRACDPDITQEEADRISYWWKAHTRLEIADEPLLARLEGIVEHLKRA